VAQVKDQCRALVNMIRNLRVPYKAVSCSFNDKMHSPSKVIYTVSYFDYM
jgi:hypothetical protein